MMEWPVHLLISANQVCLGQPLLFCPSTLPCIIVCANVSGRQVTCPNYCNFRLLTTSISGSYSPVRPFSLCTTVFGDSLFPSDSQDSSKATHFIRNDFFSILLLLFLRLRWKFWVKKRRKKQPWMAAEILDKCDERRKLKAVKYKDYDSGEKYRELNNKVRTAIREANEVFYRKKVQRGATRVRE